MSANATSHGIRRVAVLGAGVMGAQIAALIASKGLECDLLDVSTEMVEASKSRLLTTRPRVLDDRSALDRIHAGSFDSDMHRLGEADWIIEAIVERARPKMELWRNVAEHISPCTLLSTNTSGIPISKLAQSLPAKLRRMFLGTHFFNPPRYLPLLEIIPTRETRPAVVSAVTAFAEDVLEKGVVIAQDVPGFITNRIGCFYLLTAIRAAEEYGLTPNEADAVSGTLMARSNSATYRTIDLVGVDILLDICDNTRAAVESQEEKNAFAPPEYLREMRRRNWLGHKSGQGFYLRERSSGVSGILELNTNRMQYVKRRQELSGSLEKLASISDVGERLRALIGSQDASGLFAWRTLSQLLAFSAAKVGEVAEDIVSIDSAMRWGFNWELGPFETWDALGVADTIGRMEEDGLTVPAWVKVIGQAGGCFYRAENDTLMYALPSGKYDSKSIER